MTLTCKHHLTRPLDHPCLPGCACVRFKAFFDHTFHGVPHGSLTLNEPLLHSTTRRLGVERPAFRNHTGNQQSGGTNKLSGSSGSGAMHMRLVLVVLNVQCVMNLAGNRLN